MSVKVKEKLRRKEEKRKGRKKIDRINATDENVEKNGHDRFHFHGGGANNDKSS